ncbi:efflux RND transporter periplasmic adaptor subunit [bacterium]|nr:efflux RND transporter periplasmic adaptor subunit [bacterium]
MKLRTLLLYGFLIVFIFGAYYAMSVIPVEQNGDLPNSESPTLETVKVLEINPQYFEQTILIPGMAQAAVDVSMGARIPGIVEKISVKEGDFVRAGQELFQIDLRARTSQLNDAKAAWDLTQKTKDRMKAMRDKGNITAQEYDEAVTSEQRAEAIYNRLQVEVSLGKVEAPIDGVIDRIDTDVGEFVNEGKVLARLMTLDPIEIVTGVPERYADAASKEKQALVMFEALIETRPAEIKRLAFGADAQTNTFEATLTLTNPDHRIRPGMIARVRIVTKREEQALLVPLAALLKRESGMVVFVESGGKVEQRPLKLGGIDKDQIEVLDGLKAKDHIVIIGQQDLVDGQPVNVADVVEQTATINQSKL